MKYRLTKNAYLTVIGLTYHYNRNFEKGEEFEKEATHGDYITLISENTLIGENYRVWVRKDRLAECFELVWGDTGIFKKSPYFTENDDED